MRNQVCPRSIVKETQLQARQESIFDLSRKIGRLEFLDDFGAGGGTIRSVLVNVAKSSNALRIGQTSTDADNINLDNGPDPEEQLLSSMGLGAGMRGVAARFDPNVVNSAVGAAKNVVEDLKNGNYRIEDIPNRIQDFKNLERLGRSILTKPQHGSTDGDYQKFKCRPSPYALDLVARAPKQNFMFMIDIEIQPEYKTDFLSTLEIDEFQARTTGFGEGRALSNDTKNLAPQVAFLIKSSTRPSINYEYEELNFYNFRTNVAKRAMFNSVTMRFSDDQMNVAAKFYAFYINAMSPITNVKSNDWVKGATDGKSAMLEESGMAFEDFTGRANNKSKYSATIGPLAKNTDGNHVTKTVLRKLSLYQFGKNANTLTAFTMYNPKIISFQPSETTMEDSGVGQELVMEIGYDYFTIDPEVDIKVFGTDRVAKITGEDAGALYNIRNLESAVGLGEKRVESADWNVSDPLALNTVVDEASARLRALDVRPVKNYRA